MESTQKELSAKVVVSVVAIGLLIGLVVIELAFRTLSLLPVPAQWTDRPVGYFMPAPSLALQDRASKPKPKDGFRVAVVGDSFTFGPLMQLTDTFSKKLEIFLNLNSGAPPVEVQNRGFSGYSTANQLPVAKKAINEQADLLILQITLNDAEPRLLSKVERKNLFDAPYLNSRFLKAWSSLRFLLSRLHNTKSRNNYIEYHSKFFRQKDTYEHFAEAIHTMHTLCQSKGIPMVVMLFPLFDFPLDDNYPFKEVHEIIKGTAKSQGIPFLDLMEAYRGIPHDRLQVMPGKDSHPNEIAHRIAAERLLAFLAQRKLVPTSSVPKLVFRQRKELKGLVAKAGKIWHLSTNPLLHPETQERRRKSEHRGRAQRKEAT